MSVLQPFDQASLMAGYVLGDLSPEEAAAFERLADPDQVAREVAQMQTALELAYTAPEVAPPPNLRQRILTAAEAMATPIDAVSSTPEEIAPVSVAQTRPGTTQTAFPWGKAFAVAATAVIALLGITNYRLQTRLAQQTPTPVPSLNKTPIADRAYVLKGPTTDAGSAQLSVNPETLAAKLTVENLPPLPSNQVYVLWTVVDQKAPVTKDVKGAILTTSFQVNAAGQFSTSLVIPPIYRDRAWVKAFAITVESATAPQAHRGTVKIIAKT